MSEKTVEELQAELDEKQKALDAAAADAEKWKGLSRKHEDRAKGNADAAAKVKAAEDAAKTAEQKLADGIKDLGDRLNASDARAMRAEVAASKKLTPAQARRLQGSTVEELEADADDLLETFKPTEPATDEGGEENEPGKGDGDKTSGKPKEKLRAGATSSGDAEDEKPMAEVLAGIPRA